MESFKLVPSHGAKHRACICAAFKTFIEERVDVAIIEVGLGGRLDATNIVPSPNVCGISSLGYDHMELLGYTLTVLPSHVKIQPKAI